MKYIYTYGTCDEATIDIDENEVMQDWKELDGDERKEYHDFSEYLTETIESKIRSAMARKHGRGGYNYRITSVSKPLTDEQADEYGF